MKRWNISHIVVSILCAALLLLCFGCTKTEASPYGVFVGIGPDEADRLVGYQTVVIDAAEFTASDIKMLHKEGHTVYSYLNIGSIESYRDYYPQFEESTLGEYQNWPDERWIDVSSSEWQSFVVETLARELKAKGVDGFFLDNADVWYEYPSSDIYKGLLDILKGLRQYDLPLIINGGDTFVTEALKCEDLTELVEGVNQENVFSAIDFEHHSFGPQSADQNAYFKDYLAKCKDAGLIVYLTEYSTDEKVMDKIKKYCGQNNFYYYISSSIGLDE